MRLWLLIATLAAWTCAAGGFAAYVYDAKDFAVEVVSSSGLTVGSPYYHNANAVLGRPTLWFNNSPNPNVLEPRRVKLVEPAFNLGLSGENLVTTLPRDSQITVRMGRKVYDDPNNPYGLDLIVFGNSHFAGASQQYGDDSTNLNTFMLSNPATGSLEAIKVSVSQDGQTWYRYDGGPYADSLFPTNAYRWDQAAAQWTNEELDPTKPVNPAYTLANFNGLSAAGALALYDGSAGGTGFDLAASGFAWIQYVKFEGLSGYSGGEIDAVAAVRAVPEPAGLAVLLLGAAALLRRRREAR